MAYKCFWHQQLHGLAGPAPISPTPEARAHRLWLQRKLGDVEDAIHSLIAQGATFIATATEAQDLLWVAQTMAVKEAACATVAYSRTGHHTSPPATQMMLNLQDSEHGYTEAQARTLPHSKGSRPSAEVPDH